MRARLEVTGVRANVERLDAIGDRARRPEPVLRSPETLARLNAGQRRKFLRGGWQKDTPAWIARKKREGLSTRTLVATGRLESALTQGAGSGVMFSAFNAELRWGIKAGRSDLYYAQALAKGVRGRRKSRMVLIDKVTKAEIAVSVERYVVTGVIS